MGWRNLVARRESRRQAEDRDLPPSMRQGSDLGNTAALLPYVIVMGAILGVTVYETWTHGHRRLTYVVLGMAIVAVFIAARVARSHRASNAKSLRTPPESETLEMEE